MTLLKQRKEAYNVAIMKDKFSALLNVRIVRVSTVQFFVIAQLKNQIIMLNNLGARVSIVCSYGEKLNLIKEFKNIKCLTIDIPRAISIWRDLFALFRLFFFLKCNVTHILHSTTPKAGLLSALAGFMAGVPVRLHTFTGQPWVNMYGIKRWVMRSSDKLIGILNTRCYADSESQRQFLIENRIVTCERIFVIGAGSLAGIDLKRFDRNRFSLDERGLIRKSLGIQDYAYVLIFVGRITVDKGIRELLQAFEILKANSINVHLILVGPFDIDGGVSENISRVEIKNIPNLHLIGFSESPERYLAISDVLCLPSYREGFGTVVIEAAAMGVPTVGFDIYGLSDAVVPGETGLLVPLRNVKELANAIKQLLTDKLLHTEMAVAAKLRAHNLFDEDVVNVKIAEEYCFLLQDKLVDGVVN
jgi:glycosyltransferase involved in cell wall biosynthesis